MMKSLKLKTSPQMIKFFNLKNSYSLGQMAEKLAIKFLQKNKWIILEHNFKTAVGEIDIIAQKEHTLVAFEVKYRSNIEILPYTISNKQQTRIAQALLLYLQANNNFKTYDIRFDAILINKQAIQHIDNAWITKG